MRSLPVHVQFTGQKKKPALLFSVTLNAAAILHLCRCESVSLTRLIYSYTHIRKNTAVPVGKCN